ncbi:MAG: hypothetical protein C4295_06905 [Candidatus Fervidibacterota bacterium]
MRGHIENGRQHQSNGKKRPQETAATQSRYLSAMREGGTPICPRCGAVMSWWKGVPFCPRCGWREGCCD